MTALQNLIIIYGFIPTPLSHWFYFTATENSIADSVILRYNNPLIRTITLTAMSDSYNVSWKWFHHSKLKNVYACQIYINLDFLKQNHCTLKNKIVCINELIVTYPRKGPSSTGGCQVPQPAPWSQSLSPWWIGTKCPVIQKITELLKCCRLH